MSSFVKTLFLRGSTVLATLILFIWLPENMAFEAFYCLNYFCFFNYPFKSCEQSEHNEREARVKFRVDNNFSNGRSNFCLTTNQFEDNPLFFLQSALVKKKKSASPPYGI